MADVFTAPSKKARRLLNLQIALAEDLNMHEFMISDRAVEMLRPDIKPRASIAQRWHVAHQWNHLAELRRLLWS